jgi:hypothetical protein
MEIGVDSFGAVISEPATGVTLSPVERMDNLLEDNPGGSAVPDFGRRSPSLRQTVDCRSAPIKKFRSFQIGVVRHTRASDGESRRLGVVKGHRWICTSRCVDEWRSGGQRREACARLGNGSELSVQQNPEARTVRMPFEQLRRPLESMSGLHAIRLLTGRSYTLFFNRSRMSAATASGLPKTTLY